MGKKKDAGNETIHVFARVRPLLVSEAEQYPEKEIDEIRAIDIVSDRELCLRRGRQEYKCPVDGVFGPVHKQEDVFSAVHDVVDSVVEGVNATIFAYGQTGTGKTYTMVGRHPDARGTPAAVEQFEPDEESDLGIIPRAVERLFTLLSSKGSFEMYCSFLEIYNEQVYDLIANHSGIAEKGRQVNSLGIRGAVTNGLPEVMGLSRIAVESPRALMELVNKCNAIRSIRSTEYNDRSNRSHTILQVILEQKSETGKRGTVKIVSKLSLVDLAGSEKWKRSHSKGMDDKRLAEMTKINQSLTTLGRCISALADGTGHVPYRESKLTRILQDSLGGNCRTVFIVALSPSIANSEESYSTLRFADRAKQVMVHAVVNEVDTADVTVTQKMRYEREIERLKKLLAQAQRSGQAPGEPQPHPTRGPSPSRIYRTKLPGPVGSSRQAGPPRSSLTRTSKTEELLRRQVTLLKQSQQNYEAEISRMKGLLKSKKASADTNAMKHHLATLEHENAALRGALQAAEAMVEKERQARERMRAAIRSALQKQAMGASVDLSDKADQSAKAAADGRATRSAEFPTISEEGMSSLGNRTYSADDLPPSERRRPDRLLVAESPSKNSDTSDSADRWGHRVGQPSSAVTASPAVESAVYRSAGFRSDRGEESTKFDSRPPRSGKSRAEALRREYGPLDTSIKPRIYPDYLSQTKTKKRHASKETTTTTSGGLTSVTKKKSEFGNWIYILGTSTSSIEAKKLAKALERQKKEKGIVPSPDDVSSLVKKQTTRQPALRRRTEKKQHSSSAWLDGDVLAGRREDGLARDAHRSSTRHDDAANGHVRTSRDAKPPLQRLSEGETDWVENSTRQYPPEQRYGGSQEDGGYLEQKRMPPSSPHKPMYDQSRVRRSDEQPVEPPKPTGEPVRRQRVAEAPTAEAAPDASTSSLSRLEALKQAMASLQQEKQALLDGAEKSSQGTDTLASLRQRVAMLRQQVTDIR